MAKRHIIRLELTESAKNRLKGLADSHGMTQVAVMSRVIEWFAGQSELVQAAIVGRFPKEIESDVARLVLKKLAGETAIQQ